MKDTILNEIDACEREKGVMVPFAVESGSRCWGLDSPTSDYDVRFVYLRPKSDYLRLDNVRDTIEWRMDDEMDVVGWDLCKFMRLMRGSNPTVYEWLGSTITYREENPFRMVRDIAPECFSPVACAHHYYGMAHKNDARYLRHTRVTKKLYLYAVRGFLACKWSILEQKPIPMAFEELKQAMLEPEMGSLVDDLVESKRNSLEREQIDNIPELDKWILEKEASLKDEMASLRAPKKVEWPVLNEIFVRMLDAYVF